MTTVLLADDHEMVRDSLARVLDIQPDIEVVAQAANGIEMLELVEQFQPDCIVMDYSMPDHHPVEVIPRINGQPNSPKVIVLTVYENVHYAVRVLRAGAHGYVIKAAAVDELLTAINSVCEGGSYISKKIADLVWDQLRNPKMIRSGISTLSEREYEVICLLGQGKSLQECAKRMGVKVSTVSTYRARTLEKLSLETTNDLIRFAIENDLHR